MRGGGSVKRAMSDIRLRWARNGAVFGAILAAADAMGWRGQKYESWTSAEGIVDNLGLITGAIVGGAVIFLIAAVIRQMFSREP
jgi:hypothetical protein